MAPAGARDDDTIDVEELAVLEGIKPAMRSTLLAEEVDAAAARMRKRGLVVRVGERPQRYLDTNDRPWTPVYIAKTIEAAERLATAEAASSEDGSRALGLALGYPACCVRSFVDRTVRFGERPGLRWPLRFLPIVRRLYRHGAQLGRLEVAAVSVGADDYLAAREAWCEAPDARLNNLHFRLRARLVSHVPCTYACAQSVTYAAAVAATIAKVRPAALARIRTLVARPVLVAPSTARAVVSTERGRITSAEALSEPNAPRGTEAILALDRELARVAPGLAVGDRGLVALPDSWPPAVLLDFRWPN